MVACGNISSTFVVVEPATGEQTIVVSGATTVPKDETCTKTFFDQREFAEKID